MKQAYATGGFVFGNISLCVLLLLLIPTFPIWQGIHASLLTGNSNEAAGDQALYSAWMYFRNYRLQAGDANESSMRNELGQEAANRSLILQEQSDDDTRLDPGDISRDGDMLTPDLLAEKLRSLNSTQVADYPLHQLSSDDILATFNILSDTDIQKVLANTKPDSLQTIFSKLPGSFAESIFNRLDATTKSYVLSSIGRSVILP
ncbi:MAG TPA: hypothetical protein VKA09_16320 [Nitrososphaeraceae archaeon]|nr:hypothetical protein [Nitrososphaeraceae archaeon]HKI09957.1 hypothetical protein [Nitrososphaeraceae archaeon]